MHIDKTLRILFAAIAGSIFLFASAHAAAPMVKGQAPGYYRMMIGHFEVTALSDGTAALPVSGLQFVPGQDGGRIHRLLQGQSGQDQHGQQCT